MSEDESDLKLIEIIETSRYYRIKISSHGIQNGLIRLKVDLNEINRYFRRYSRYFLFKLEYQTLSCHQNSSTEWTHVSFQSDYIKNQPEMHINIRVDTKSSAYSIRFRLAVMTKLTLQSSANSPRSLILRKNKWSKWSNIVQIEVPSIMKDFSFEINDWIKFKYMTNRDKEKWAFGTITNKKYIASENKYIYKVSHYRTSKEYEIIEINGDRQFMKHFACQTYLDLSNRINADCSLLIGDRDERANDVYVELGNLFYTQYALKIFKGSNEYNNNLDYVSMAKCVAFHVIDFLWSARNERYQIRCCLNKEDKSEHFDDVLRLYSTRQYQTAKAGEMKECRILDSVFGCDICLCRQGDYGWMYRCQLNKKCKYDGHDICLMCIYDMITRYNQLNGLLQELLSNYLTDDCTQIVVAYTVGDVVRL